MHGLTIGGGPEVVTPTRRGFGTRLVKEGTAFELRGSAVIDYAPGGVVCVVEIPFTATVSAGVHILIAEDEIFLAMMLQDLLEADGYEVSNAASVSDALAAIECKLPSAAILDVNLAGEKSYAVAQALRERGVPFLVATGYGERSLPEEFAGEQTMQKPYLSHRMRTQLSAAGSAGAPVTVAWSRATPAGPAEPR